MSGPVEMEKVTLRRAVTRRRRERSARDRELAAEAIALHAAGLPALISARRVAAYLSIPTEPGTGPLLQWWADRGVEVLLPVSLPDRTMDWVQASGGAPVPGGLGVPEPQGPRLGAGALSGCDLAVVPALAVDHAGHRLGRGAGYYDRALAGFPGLVCALVFADELLPAVPHAPHDHPVDLVLTPAGPFRPERG